MRYQFLKFFFEATPAPAGGNPAPAPAPQPSPTPAPAPNPPAPKPDDTTALKAQIEALEKKITELSTPKPTTPAPEKDKDDKIPAWAKTLVEQNEKLATQLTTLQTEKTNIARKVVFEAELKAIEGLPEHYRNEVLENFEGRTFATDADFDAFKKKKVEAATKVAEDVAASSLSVFTPPKASAAGGNTNKVSSAMETFLKSKQPSKN